MKNDKLEVGKTTANIPTAQLVSNDFRCHIKVNRKVNSTKGKAHLVDSLPLANNMTRSSILQQDKKKAWVVFDTIHPSTETVVKAFDTRDKTDEDKTMFLVPFIMIIGMMGALEIYLIKKTAIDKEPIILTRTDWIILMLLTALVFTVMSFITYHLFTQKFHYSLFQSYAYEKTGTYVFYLNGLLQNVTAVVYYGRFWVGESQPDQLLFGYGPEELEGGVVDDDGFFYINKIIDLRAKYMDMLEEKSQSVFELEDKKLILQDELLQLKSDDKEKTAKLAGIGELDKKIEERAKEADTALATLNEEIDKIQTDYFTKIKILVNKEIDEKRVIEILYSNETISALKNKVARMTINNIRLQKNLGQMYAEGVEGAEQFNERVTHKTADQSLPSVQFQMFQNELNSPGKNGQSGDQVNWDPLIQTGIKLLLIVGFMWFAFYILTELVSILAGISTAALVGGLIAFVIVIGLLSRMVNKVVSWTKAADSTVVVQ